MPYGDLIVMNYEPFVIFKLISGLCEPAWFNVLPTSSPEVSAFQPWQLQIPTPPFLTLFGVIGGGLECLKCHISPLSSDLLFSQKQASMLLADPLWMQVDLM